MDNGIPLRVDNVSVGYGGREVLHNISADFRAGKITVITGPNGCGKSTLLKSVIGLIPIRKGSVYALEENTKNLSAVQLARRIAYLPQTKNIPDLTVMTLTLHGRFSHLGYPRRYRKEDIAAAEEALKITELSALADEPLSRLSGGTQQRAFLAMALAQGSPVLLMDEPTTFLDLSFQIKLMKLCRKLADEGKAVVTVLHDLPAALKYADEIFVMSDGNIAAHGTPEEVYGSGILNEVFDTVIKRVDSPDGAVYYF